MAANIPRGYIPNRTMKEVEQNFTDGRVGTVDDFIKNNFRQENASSGQTVATASQIVPKTTLKDQSFTYLSDRGEGRISKGVLSLEGITKALKGIPIHSLTLFDQVIYTYPYAFNSNNLISLRDEVYANLGITAYVPVAAINAPVSVAKLNQLVDVIIKDIKNFTFKFDNYIDLILPITKGVVQAAINSGGISVGGNSIAPVNNSPNTGANTSINNQSVIIPSGSGIGIQNGQNIFEIIGDRTYTDATFVTSGQTITASIQALDSGLKAFGESNLKTNITTATVVDAVNCRQVQAVKWFIKCSETHTPSNRKILEIVAAHNGTQSVDATATDTATFSVIETGGHITGLTFKVDINGAGIFQTMNLIISSASPVDVAVARIKL